MSNLVHRPCPSCGEDNAAAPVTPFGNVQWPIKACRGCGFVYLETAPVYERLVDEFAWEKTSASQTQRRVAKAPIQQFLSQQLKIVRHRWLKRDKLPYLVRRFVMAGNVLDIGCGGGGALEGLVAHHIPHGIEISRVLAQKATEKVAPRGGRIVHDAAVSGLKQFPANLFSGVLLSAFLEHEIAPKILLAGVFRTLLPGGHCIIKVPNFGSVNRMVRGKEWCGFRLPDHVNYFTPDSLVQMCQQVGFHIAKFSFADRLPTSDNMWLVIQKPL